MVAGTCNVDVVTDNQRLSPRYEAQSTDGWVLESSNLVLGVWDWVAGTGWWLPQMGTANELGGELVWRLVYRSLS